VLIQDIESMRRDEGIEDPELQDQIAHLKRGDFVKITLVAAGSAVGGETVRVRITAIRNGVYRGLLASQPSSPSLSEVHVGDPVVFRHSHIHSLSARPAVRR
jgi:hypothetical protein